MAKGKESARRIVVPQHMQAWVSVVLWNSALGGLIKSKYVAEILTAGKPPLPPDPQSEFRTLDGDMPVIGLSEIGDEMLLTIESVGTVMYSRSNHSQELARRLRSAAELVEQHERIGEVVNDAEE